jgi:elongator complex protein 1
VGGDIVVVREDPLPGEDKIEIVGSVDVGITAAKWSPDEELLAITTKANTLVFMSRSFEGIMDVAMTSEDLKASNHVSVGWGKKETQFQGRGAKALKDPTMPEKVDEGVLSPNDDGEATITWRGDGAYVAVSTIEGGVRRLIRVYSREGVLDSVTEPVDGLEGSLSWRPAGNLMAGIQRLSDRIDVVFFERNGLRHGQFSLRLSPEQMATSGKTISLEWNSDSTVLAVILADRIQLWTMGNYHWYLKQDITLLETTFTSLKWHPEKALSFLVAKDGKCFTTISNIKADLNRCCPYRRLRIHNFSGFNISSP